MKEEKKRVIDDKLTRFGAHTPLIMEVETTKNNLR